uniref:Uncharacterized protein n=1 Tax=Tolypothrix bouteillei VB521301 TaxID=1479485 RepID=A0A0C1NAM1_9CYAN
MAQAPFPHKQQESFKWSQVKKQKTPSKNNKNARFLLTLSAKSERALSELVGRYQTFLADEPTEALAGICFSANVRRSPLSRKSNFGKKSHTLLKS